MRDLTLKEINILITAHELLLSLLKGRRKDLKHATTNEAKN